MHDDLDDILIYSLDVSMIVHEFLVPVQEQYLIAEQHDENPTGTIQY